MRQRNRRRDAVPSQPVGAEAKVLDASASRGEVAQPPQAGGGKSAMAGPLRIAPLLQHPRPSVVQSPFGQAYLTKKTRSIAADAVQAVGSIWDFDVRGYFASGVSTGHISEYNAAKTILEDWYPLARQQCKHLLKYKHSPTSLTNTDVLADQLNAYHFGVSNLVTLLNLERLFQYNQAFSTFTQYLPQKLSRAKRLYRRFSAIFMPPAFKAECIRDGLIAFDPGKRVPHFRLWNATYLTTYGGASDYSDISNLGAVYTLLQTSASIDSLLNSIEAALWALETSNISFDTDLRDDWIACKDMIDMLNDVKGGGLFQQGLPAEDSYDGLSVDKKLFEDYYTAALLSRDTDGVINDHVMFPVQGMTEFNSLIPVAGYGNMDFRAFTLFGSPKCGLLNSTPGDTGVNSTDEFVLYGMKHLAAQNDADAVGHAFVNAMVYYTREDGWKTKNLAGTNFSTGSDVATLMGAYHPMHDHLHQRHMWAQQVSVEYDWLDNAPVDWLFYMEPDDLGPNTAMLLAAMLDVPYLK